MTRSQIKPQTSSYATRLINDGSQKKSIGMGELISRYRKGDGKALVEIMDKIDISRLSENFARTYSGTKFAPMIDSDACLCAAEDKVMEALAGSNLDVSRCDSALRNYFITCAYNGMRDLARDYIKKSPDSLNVDIPTAAEGTVQFIDILGNERRSKSSETDIKDRWFELDKALKSSLTETQYELLHFMVILGGTDSCYRLASQHFGIPLGTVKSRMNSIRTSLAKYPEVCDYIKEVCGPIDNKKQGYAGRF